MAETHTRIARRIAAISESATLKVDAKAKALKAAGRPVISYAAGEPDFATPEHIVEAAAAATHDVKNHRYTPAAGLPELREAIAEKTLRDSGLEVSPGQVIVTNGGKQAVYQAFQTIVDDGDEVLLPAPYWTTYPEVVRLAGGVPVEVFAGADQNYLVTVEQLEAARTPRTKVLLFVSPSNPTGSVYSPEQTRAIGEWALEHGIWVITDEIDRVSHAAILSSEEQSGVRNAQALHTPLAVISLGRARVPSPSPHHESRAAQGQHEGCHAKSHSHRVVRAGFRKCGRFRTFRTFRIRVLRIRVLRVRVLRIRAARLVHRCVRIERGNDAVFVNRVRHEVRHL